MHSELYNAPVTCPICEKDFIVVKAKSGAYKMSHKDEDFCIHYRELNPLLYDIWICEHCGYAEFAVLFNKISVVKKIRIQKFCLTKFTNDPLKNPFDLTDYHKRVYSFFDKVSSEGERDNLAAIDTFEILLIIMSALQAPESDMAKVALRIGWIYRMMNDPKEFEYLEIAAGLFSNGFVNDSLDGGKFDSATCAYMAGELYRRINDSSKAVEWFGKALKEAQNTGNSDIAKKTRNQILATKELRS